MKLKLCHSAPLEICFCMVYFLPNSFCHNTVSAKKTLVFLAETVCVCACVCVCAYLIRARSWHCTFDWLESVVTETQKARLALA